MIATGEIHAFGVYARRPPWPIGFACERGRTSFESVLMTRIHLRKRLHLGRGQGFRAFRLGGLALEFSRSREPAVQMRLIHCHPPK